MTSRKDLATLFRSLPAISVESSISQYRTASSTIHKLYLNGDLQPWPSFLSDAQTIHTSNTWSKKIFGYKLKVRDPYTYANVELGDETRPKRYSLHNEPHR